MASVLETGFYIVEIILDKKTNKNGVFYKVRWQGYTEQDDTWEPAENLKSCQSLLDEFERVRGTPKKTLTKRKNPTSTSPSGTPPAKKQKMFSPSSLDATKSAAHQDFLSSLLSDNNNNGASDSHRRDAPNTSVSRVDVHTTSPSDPSHKNSIALLIDENAVFGESLLDHTGPAWSDPASSIMGSSSAEPLPLFESDPSKDMITAAKSAVEKKPHALPSSSSSSHAPSKAPLLTKSQKEKMRELRNEANISGSTSSNPALRFLDENSSNTIDFDEGFKDPLPTPMQDEVPSRPPVSPLRNQRATSMTGDEFVTTILSLKNSTGSVTRLTAAQLIAVNAHLAEVLGVVAGRLKDSANI